MCVQVGVPAQKRPDAAMGNAATALEGDPQSSASKAILAARAADAAAVQRARLVDDANSGIVSEDHLLYVSGDVAERVMHKFANDRMRLVAAQQKTLTNLRTDVHTLAVLLAAHRRRWEAACGGGSSAAAACKALAPTADETAALQPLLAQAAAALEALDACEDHFRVQLDAFHARAAAP